MAGWRKARPGQLRHRRAFALAALAVLAVCVAAGWFPQEPLRALVERRLQAALGNAARIGSLHVVPASLAVEARDVLLDAPSFHLELPRGRVVLAFGSVLRQLLPGRDEAAPLRLRELELDAPRLVLRASEETAEGATVLPSIVVDHFSVSDGGLAYEDSEGPRAALSGVEVHGAIGSGTLRAGVREGVWHGPQPIAFGPARAEMSISAALAIDLAFFDLQLGRSRLEARGPLGGAGAWTPRLDLSAHLELEDLAAFGAARFAGGVDLTGQLAGPLDAVAFDVDAQGAALELAGWSVDELSGKLSRPAGGRTSLTWTARLYSGQAVGEAQLAGNRSDGQLRVSGLELDRLATDLGTRLGGWRGSASGEARWSGDITGSVHVTAGASSQLRSEGRTIDASLSLAGPVDLPSRSLDLEWDVRAAPSLGLVAGRVSGHGSAKGPLPPALDARLDGELLLSTPGGPETATLRGTARSAAGLSSAELELNGLGGSLTLSAQLREGVFERLTAKADALHLEPLGAGGTARLSASGSGPWNRLTGHAELAVAGAIWRDVPLGDVTFQADSTRGDVVATLAVPALDARGQARLPAGPSPTLSVALSLDGTRLEAFAPLGPSAIPLRGSLTAELDLSVPVARPEALVAEARVETLVLETRNESVANTGPFVVRARAGRLTLEGLQLRGPGVQLDVSGSAGTGGGAPLDVTAAAELELGELSAVPGWSLRGHLAARVGLKGRVDKPRATGFVSAQDLTIEAPGAPAVSIPAGRIELDSDRLELQGLTAHVAGGDLTLQGLIPLAAVLRAARQHAAELGPGEQAAVSLTFEGLDIATLVDRLRADASSPVSGRVSGRLDVAGGLLSPTEARASLRLVPEAVSIQDLGLEVSPLSLTIDAGEAVLDTTTLTGQGSQLAIGGRVDLERRTLDGSARGELDLRALSPFLPDAAVSGRGQVDLVLTGPLLSPLARGLVEVHDGSLRLRTLPQALTGLEGRFVLEDERVRIESARATLGGGSLSLSGGAALTGGAVSGVEIELVGKDVALRYPEGLRSRLDTELKLEGKPGSLRLSGVVRAQQGLYDLDTALEQSLLASAVEAEASPLLRGVALDVRVETVNPVLIRNNLARLDATGSLNLLGDLDRPAPIGRLDLQPGGRIFLQQREFVVESGRLAYDGTWDPEVSLQAEAVLRGVDLGNLYGRQDVRVGVKVEGPLARPRVSFSSDPSGFSEAEIATMIVSNRSRSDALASGAWVAGEQTALLLTGRLTRGLTSGLQGLGIDEVTIQPELLARETDPGARFTFGKHLTDELRLVYSLSLNDPENRFVELDLDPWRDVSLLAQRREDGSVTLGGGQRLRFFGPPRRPAYREPKLRLQELRLEVQGAVSERAVRDLLHAKAGDTVSEWDLQDDAERVRQKLRARGYIEAEVAAHADGEAAVFRVASGPRFEWRVDGMPAPPSLDPVVGEALFEEDALARGRARLIDALHERGYLEAAVETSVVADDGVRRLVFSVAPGERLTVRTVRFPGATLSSSLLLASAGGPARILADPEGARQAIRGAYRDRHYLAAEVSSPEVSRGDGGVLISVPVVEGQPARVSAVRFFGVSLPPDELTSAARIPTGRPFDQEIVLRGVDRIRDLYFGRGYPSVRVSARVEAAGSDLEVVFDVVEGPQRRVGPIEIVGLGNTSEAFVRRTLGFGTGDALDPRRLAAAERRLLALGIFARASITHSGEDPATVNVELEQEARVAAGYQARYNDDRGLSGDVDGELRNLLGRGLTLGTRYSRGKDDERIRGSIYFPSLGFFGNLTGSVFRNSDEMSLDDALGSTLRQLEQGLELQAARPLPSRWNLLYGYRFKTAHVSSDLDEFSTTTRIASLDVSLLRDTRDNPLDARRGRFWSLNLELAPRLLASDLDFAKGMAQLFVSRSFGPSLTWAQGYRLGLAHVFSGERLVFSERFRAGGGNSIRGFATDSVGPRDFFDEPAGGEAVIVLNQELRFRHRSGLGGAVFWDAGNVFARASDLSLDLRHALGAGLRWDSPVGLLRVDVGLPLQRRTDEKAYRIFFSLGQAF